MSWTNLIDRITGNTVTAADINTLMENIRVLGGNGTSAPSTDIETLASSSGSPVGTVLPWDKTNASTPALSSSFKECDGSLISDAGSVYNGERIENLNGANVALTLTWTADAGGAYATVASADLPALSEGDDVTGSGIAASSYISDITGTTVTITDVSATGSIASTFTNDGLFLSGASASGVGKKDQMQTHRHAQGLAVGASSVGRFGAYTFGSSGGQLTDYASALNTVYGALVSEPVPTTLEDAPRIGTSTYPSHRKYVMIKKIK